MKAKVILLFFFSFFFFCRAMKKESPYKLYKKLTAAFQFIRKPNIPSFLLKALDDKKVFLSELGKYQFVSINKKYMWQTQYFLMNYKKKYLLPLRTLLALWEERVTNENHFLEKVAKKIKDTEFVVDNEITRITQDVNDFDNYVTYASFVQSNYVLLSDVQQKVDTIDPKQLNKEQNGLIDAYVVLDEKNQLLRSKKQAVQDLPNHFQSPCVRPLDLYLAKYAQEKEAIEYMQLAVKGVMLKLWKQPNMQKQCTKKLRTVTQENDTLKNKLKAYKSYLHTVPL